ncbi:hypothetical protein ABZ369_39470, partial [Streptomyces sp. NPDC005918]
PARADPGQMAAGRPPPAGEDDRRGPSRRRGVLLVQPYATQAGNLSVRLAPGIRGVAGVAKRRLTRLLRSAGGAAGR